MYCPCCSYVYVVLAPKLLLLLLLHVLLVLILSASKMNTMHWHITDGNSVPIESKLFPDLNKKGAYNPVTMIYTQEQIKGVVDYARHRGIRVVPEFDM